MNTKESIYHIDHIYHRHADRLRTFAADTDLVNYAMLSALNELAAAMQQITADEATFQNIVLDIELVLQSHDPTHYEKLVSGEINLPTALDITLTRLSQEIDRLRQQLLQLDADNARLTAELRTVRSWSIAPSTPEMP